VTRGKIRASVATSSPLNRVTRNTTPRAVTRIMESETNRAADAVQNDQLAIFKRLVESLTVY
jgi:lipopolysaccharide biosynthesis regulator YciM